MDIPAANPSQRELIERFTMTLNEDFFRTVNFSAHLDTINKDKDPLGLVLYTDGGWRANPDMGGWGAHGYFYTDKEPKQGTGCKDAILTARGYLKKDSTEAKPVSAMGYVDMSGGIPVSTNNHAELEALIMSLVCGLVNNVAMLTLKLDSEYALKGATERLERMRRSNFINPTSGSPIPNISSWQLISDLLTVYTERSVPITWLWVKGHSDSVGNNKADLLATRGITMGRNGNYVYDAVCRRAPGYWNPAVEYNRLLNESRWYFQTGRVQDGSCGYYTYYLGSHGPDDKDFGKPASDVNYAVVRLEEKDPVLSALETYVTTAAPDKINRIMIGRLDFIFNPTHYADILNGGATLLMHKGPRLDFYINDKTPLLAELDPPRRGLDAAVEINRLELILERVIANDEPQNYVLNDITDLIYETDVSKKKPVTKIKGHIDSSLSSLKLKLISPVNVEPVEVNLTIGIDTPSRNMMASYAAEGVRAIAVTWRESDQAFRYGTVIMSGHNVGIWAGAYSNIRILPTKS